MVHRLWFLVIPLMLLTVAARSDGQTQPELPPTVLPFPPLISAEKVPILPVAKELSKQQFDGLIERAFGADCEELGRPIRIWIAELGIVVTAKKASVANDGHSVRLVSPSIGIRNGEARTFRADEAVIQVEDGLVEWKELGNRKVSAIVLHGKNSIITLTPFTPPPVANAPLNVSVFKDGDVQVIGPLKQLELRFKFKLDPKASLADLLPKPAKTSPQLPMWTNEDLAKVPELTFGEPLSKDLTKIQAMEKTAHVMAKINHLNGKKRDGFMLAMLEQRSDLRGLPFLMGDECRTRENQAKIFAELANAIGRLSRPEALGLVEHSSDRTGEEEKRATVAVLMQVAMSESKMSRIGLAKTLATISHIDATKALAKLAIFSPEDEVRADAIEGLKLRRERDYTDILLQGFRYPLPAVSKRAAEALVKLERKDLLANLVEVLESPDPRLPVTEKRDGKDVTFVRELVKVNHHRNCLLCHAPGNTDNTPEGVLKVAVPLPSEPLPKPSDGGGYQSTPPATPDIVVRLDMTYLRQDFSQMMPVSDAHPWPEMQRFDFLVRTRILTAAEAQAYEECCELPEPGQISPYHRSALFALRELTGRDTEPTAAAWRKLLKLTK